jgi:hypothetical protein
MMLEQRLRNLSKSRIVVKCPGNYPDKSRTPVVDVCMYQNDGTDRVTASKFIERASEVNAAWVDELNDAVFQFISGGGDIVLRNVAQKIAKDISTVCDRIDTGRLKRSFVGQVLSK